MQKYSIVSKKNPVFTIYLSKNAIVISSRMYPKYQKYTLGSSALSKCFIILDWLLLLMQYSVRSISVVKLKQYSC